VVQPVALLCRGNRREGVPVSVHLGLAFARDGEGDGFVELEVRAPIQATELSAHQGEVNGQDVSLLPAREVRRRFDDLVDMRIREEGYVEPRGLLRLAVEPEARDDILHGGLVLLWWSARILRHVSVAPCGFAGRQ